jgi:hypothetical protein
VSGMFPSTAIVQRAISPPEPGSSTALTLAFAGSLAAAASNAKSRTGRRATTVLPHANTERLVGLHALRAASSRSHLAPRQQHDAREGILLVRHCDTASDRTDQRCARSSR